MRCHTQAHANPRCEGTATHMLIYSTPDMDREPGETSRYLDPVCKPCGYEFIRRDYYRAVLVPLHIYNPTPEFKDIAGGHRLVDHPFHEAACHDCLLLGSVEYFRQGRDKGLHGCRARPESVNSRELAQADIGPDTTRDELASRWRKYVTHEVGMGIGGWRPIKDDRLVVATFTFRDREYVLMHSPSIPYVWAEKLENRGRLRPDRINTQYETTYKQVVFHIHGLENKYENTYFITWTPGRQDVILHAAEGQIRAVLRLTGLTRPGDPLAEVTDAVCDTFGAIADITFQTRIYE